MKMREVVLRAIAKKITWDQAADILGMSHSAMWRLRGLYQRRGYDGFWVRATRKPGGLPVPLSTLERVLLLYQQRYSHLDARAFQKILRREYSIHLDYACLSQALREAGLTPHIQSRSEHD
jgi:transposase